MTTETIEGEATELDEPRALVPVAPDAGMTASGPMALAALSDEEFDRRLHALEKGRDRVARIQRALMVPDVDYGTIPGTPKPTLLKPGAEKLCQAYSLAADFSPERMVGDGVGSPALAFVTRCQLHLGSLDGPVVAVGYGEANAWERKHRYRAAERACPDCGNASGTLMRSKQKPEFYCWRKKGGCGAVFPLTDKRITDQETGQIDNPDPWDLGTTLLKMAEKRAFVDATLRATAASGLFTQDVEDQRPPDPPPSHVDRETGEIRDEPLKEDEFGGWPAPSLVNPTEPWLQLAGVRKAGRVQVGKPPADGNRRVNPEDIPHLVFSLAADDGKVIPQCVAEGPLCDDLFDATEGGATLAGLAVTVEGDIWRVPWKKKDPNGTAREMPPFQRLILTRITWTDPQNTGSFWSLPAPKEAESLPLDLT